MGLTGRLPRRPLANLKLEPTSRLRFFSLALVSAAALFCGSARALETVVTFDPANTKVEFTLAATLHTVHGTFQLKKGYIRFNPTTGEARGEIVVDATSGNSESSDRDKKMH